MLFGLFSVSTGQTAQAASAAGTPPPTGTKGRVKRLFDMPTGTIGTRYRYVVTAAGITASNQNQFSVAVRGRLKFDRKGKYSITGGLFTGSSFTSGWNNTGWGTGAPQPHLYLKELFIEAKPGRGIEGQIGSIDINRGVSSEITSYDSDGRIIGERLTLRQPKRIYFDVISATYGFLGDLTKVSVFERFRRLQKSNYHQFLVSKKVNDRVSFSADYTFESGRDTLRQAVKFTLPKHKAIDTFQFENYEALYRPAGYGFSLTGEKRIGKRLLASAGFAHIDRQMLNGDRYPKGNRLIFQGSYQVAPDVTLSSALIHGVGSLTGGVPRTRLDLILTYNFAQLLRRKKIL